MSEDPDVMRVRTGRHQYRSQAKRDSHADAQARHRAKLRKAAAPSRSEIATVALGVFLLIIKKYRNDRRVKTMLEMIENELRLAGFDQTQITARLDRMIASDGSDLAKWRHRRAWLQEWHRRQEENRST